MDAPKERLATHMKISGSQYGVAELRAVGIEAAAGFVPRDSGYNFAFTPRPAAPMAWAITETSHHQTTRLKAK